MNFNPFDKNQKVNPKDIESYVENIMSNNDPNSMPDFISKNDFFKQSFDFMKQASSAKSGAPSKKTTIDSKVFETHDDVIVQLPIKDKKLLDSVKIFYTSNQFMIENVPEEGNKQTVILPALVKKNGAKSRYRDGVLEIKLPKKTDMQFTEIDVQQF